MPAHHPSLTAIRPWRYIPSVWDALIFALVLGLIALIAFGGHETIQPLAAVEHARISLDPSALPYYALRTTLRMLAGIVCSFIFTLCYGALAQKSRRAEMVLIPILDILQSLPVLTFLTFTLAFFLKLFPGSVLGAELCSVFTIFTAQAWNMTFSFYQSLKTVPKDLSDVSDSLRLGGWRRFWTLEVPFAAPGLIWNAMMSMSGAWFFVVASEAFSVGDTNITLPGIGAYVSTAIDHKDLGAIGWAVVTMLAVILIYDQLLFRPLVAWSQKFRVELSASSGPEQTSWPSSSGPAWPSGCSPRWAPRPAGSSPCGWGGSSPRRRQCARPGTAATWTICGSRPSPWPPCGSPGRGSPTCTGPWASAMWPMRWRWGP